MNKPLIKKGGQTVQAGNAEINAATIGYDSETDYPDGSLPKALLEKANIVVTTTEPTASEVNENDIIILVDP